MAGLGPGHKGSLPQLRPDGLRCIAGVADADDARRNVRPERLRTDLALPYSRRGVLEEDPASLVDGHWHPRRTAGLDCERGARLARLRHEPLLVRLQRRLVDDRQPGEVGGADNLARVDAVRPEPVAVERHGRSGIPNDRADVAITALGELRGREVGDLALADQPRRDRGTARELPCRPGRAVQVPRPLSSAPPRCARGAR